jgi:hypothetical protein
MRTQAQINYECNAILAGAPAPTEPEEAREAFERILFVRSKVKIEDGDGEQKDIATVRNFFTRILEKFHRPD